MKFLMDNWHLFAVAFLSGGMLLWPLVAKGARGGGVTPSMAVQLINRQKGVVVDVCETEEFARSHIVGAKNVPLNQLQQRLPEVVKNKTVPVILVCQNGARANRALAIAKSLGYEQAQVLGGGLAGWKEANLPLGKA